MSPTIDVKQLSTIEKLRLMEAIWHELSDAELPSPDWHAEVLAERDRLIRSGEEVLIDWDVAKRQLLQEFEYRSATC